MRVTNFVKKKYLIRKRALGDVIWIEPIIRKLASEFQQVIVYTKYPDLFLNYPLKNVFFKSKLKFYELLLIEIERRLKIQFYSVNLEESYEKNANMHILNAYQIKAGISLTREYPVLHLSDEEIHERIFKSKYVLLHLESFSDKKYRNIFGVKWEVIIEYLNSKGFEVVQVGLTSDHITGVHKVKTNLRELISICFHSSYFIGLDSGPSHLAASLGIPSMIFFGAINPEYRHFPEIFNGVLVKKNCEFDNNQSLVINSRYLDCKFSNNQNTASCSYYSTEEVKLKINDLLKYDKTGNLQD